MKKLTTYLNEKLIVNQRFDEKLIINKDYAHTYYPKTWGELRQIIRDTYDELGSGTEQNPIDFNDIDVSNIDSFYDGSIGIFEGTQFEYIDISWWDVSNVKDMSFMLYNCSQLKSVGDLSNWDVSGVEYMLGMFYKCEKLKSLGDLSNWIVSKVKNMYCMFFNCEKLKSVGDLSDWNVSSVIDMGYMFSNSGITNIPDWYKQ